MEASTTTTVLSSIAENTYFVLGAYFFAFFPWAVMYNIDFITEKWRTVGETRTFAYAHMISSVVPCLYVAVYAEAQRQNNDSQELGAALAALMFNLIHLLRTLMGKVQLEAYVVWCKHAMECLLALLGTDDERIEQSEGGSSGHELSNLNVAGVVEVEVRVNNTVVDNELGGTDVTVRPEWKKIWNGLKRGEFNPSKWLQADLVDLCTVRWCAAYLCAVGGDWSAKEDWVLGYRPQKRLELFFSGEMNFARGVLQNVTWKKSEGNENPEAISVKWLGDKYNFVDLSAETTAYGSRIENYHVGSTWDVEWYSFEVDSLANSYPASNAHRRRVTASLVHSVILAKHFGLEKLKGIRRHYEKYQMPKWGILEKAMKLYLKQTAWHISNESEIFNMLCDGDSTSIPLFPYRMQMVALWEQDTNWRVLQASAHADVWSCLCITETGLTPLHQFDTKPCNTFDYCMKISRNEFAGERRPGCAGVVLESVRSFLGEWQMRTTQEIEWEPVVPLECFDFNTPLNILDGNANDDQFHERMIWICQEALQREVVRISNGDQNLPSSSALIMLFLLGFPHIHMKAVEDSVVETRDRDTDVRASNSSSSRFYHSVNVSTQTLKVTTNLSPQDIWVEIRIDVDMQKCSVGLKKGSEISRFVWQEWVDAAMGFMVGYNDRGSGKVKYERKIKRANLREGMVTLCPLRTEDDVRVVETSIVEVWMGWPPFDVHICKFEMDQWLKACDIDLAAHRLLSEYSGNGRRFDDVDAEIERAERVIESVVFGQMEEVRDEINEERN